MKNLHQAIEDSVKEDLEQLIQVAECLNESMKRIPQSDFVDALKRNKVYLKNHFAMFLCKNKADQMEMIDKKIHKMEKGEFNLLVFFALCRIFWLRTPRP